jgi:hypothetical protein
MKQKPVPITGVHLKRIGDYAYVAVEIDGEWVDVIRERLDSNFSHIVEPGGMLKALAEKEAT